MNAQHVGTLEKRQSGSLSFQYTPSWLESPHSIPISLSLPLREDPFTDPRVHAYFDNLLPDNAEVRRKIAETLGATDASVFELLRIIGRDCIGAIELLEENASITHTQKVTGKPVTPKQIGNILKALPSHPQGDKDAPFRISVAGAQHKMAFLWHNDQWNVPLGTTPTTHLFKPPIGKRPHGPDLTTSVQNEWLCLQIAQTLGLHVAHAEMQTFDDLSCLVVERFDRHWTGSSLQRLPQEDLCQASGVPSTQKYESHGGPGIVQCMKFLDGSDHRDQDRAFFMRAQLAYLLLGATDGHAKNFSIFLTKSGFRMTPLYDVMTIWPAVEAHDIAWKQVKMAMAIGDSRHYDPKVILKRHWLETAKKCGFPTRDLETLIEDLQAKIQTLLKNPISLPKNFPAFLYEHTLTGLRRQANRLLS